MKANQKVISTVLLFIEQLSYRQKTNKNNSKKKGKEAWFTLENSSMGLLKLFINCYKRWHKTEAPRAVMGQWKVVRPESVKELIVRGPPKILLNGRLLQTHVYAFPEGSFILYNINWRGVQRNNVVNNVAMSDHLAFLFEDLLKNQPLFMVKYLLNNYGSMPLKNYNKLIHRQSNTRTINKRNWRIF